MDLVEQALKNDMPEGNSEEMGYGDRVLNAAEAMEKKKMSATQICLIKLLMAMPERMAMYIKDRIKETIAIMLGMMEDFMIRKLSFLRLHTIRKAKIHIAGRLNVIRKIPLT